MALKSVRYYLGEVESDIIPFPSSLLLLTDMSYMWESGFFQFSRYPTVPELVGKTLNANSDFSLWDVSNVTNMDSMFWLADKFAGKGLEWWDVNNVTNMAAICSKVP